VAKGTRSGFDEIDEARALQLLLEGTATEIGEGFFEALVENLAKVLGTFGAWVTEYLEEVRRLRALAFWLDGEQVAEYEYDIAGTPCEPVIEQACLVHYPDRIVELFPRDPDLPKFGAMSYMGAPLTDLDGRILGHLAVLDTKPMPEQARCVTLFRIFAARAAAELRRLRAEEEVRERERKLGRLVEGAMDAIVEIDRSLAVTLANPAAETIFGFDAKSVTGTAISRYLTDRSASKLGELVEELGVKREGPRHLWIPGGLTARRSDGSEFPAEATLACSDTRDGVFFTLVLRDVNERLEAERRIRALTEEAEYLREEISEAHNHGKILGRSLPMRRLVAEVRQVADTDATVLVIGETGTGKELVARAIHGGSARHDRPLVRVNCAAVPATLIESEFFGHEKGAFTGATRKRQGRFALADGGTLFLDEIGELPLDLQPKLLRVLQEGEFEPVGSSTTRHVDVRVVAATNRDLLAAVREGSFREDLYYRLSVFPIQVPPLRERKEDIPLLAAEFARTSARRLRRAPASLSPDCERRLMAYPWPGNVRELQNVIERALITSPPGEIVLDRALPETESQETSLSSHEPLGLAAPADRVLTASEIEAIDRENLVRALERTGWRVAGANGAAALLGMPPSTLASRMKALGVRRPPRKP